MAHDRLTYLKGLLQVVDDSLDESPPDRRAPLLAQARGISKEISEVEAEIAAREAAADDVLPAVDLDRAAPRAASGGGRVTALDEFKAAIRGR